MTNYKFYINYLRYIAIKLDKAGSEFKNTTLELNKFADKLDQNKDLVIEANSIRIMARALAGFSGFLQEHILPEVVAANNQYGEKELRWVIDTSMELMAKLISHAEITDNSENYILKLPKPPD
jgi:hypothetical protein